MQNYQAYWQANQKKLNDTAPEPETEPKQPENSH
jgi:hypothetical protein